MIDYSQSYIVGAIALLLFVNLVELPSAEFYKAMWEYRRSFFRSFMPSLKSENEFLDFFKKYISPLVKFGAYALLCFGLFGFVRATLDNIPAAVYFTIFHCVLLSLFYLLDCIVSAKRLKKTRIFSQWTERGLFVMKKIVPLVLTLIYSLCLPLALNSIPV